MLDLQTALILLACGAFVSITCGILAILWGKFTRPETFNRDDLLFLVKLFGAMGLLPLVFGVLMKL
jgi:hypothetical protein